MCYSDEHIRPKLLDAALWIFFVSAFSLASSVLYGLLLEGSLNLDLSRYFKIKDYLQITPYWLRVIATASPTSYPLSSACYVSRSRSNRILANRPITQTAKLTPAAWANRNGSATPPTSSAV